MIGLEHIINSKGLRIKKLAADSGVSESAIYKLISGESSGLPATWADIAVALGMKREDWPRLARPMPDCSEACEIGRTAPQAGER